MLRKFAGIRFKLSASQTNFYRRLSALPNQTSLDDISNESHASYSFQSHFHAKNLLPQDLHLTPEGCYVEVSEKDIKEYLPEGLAGDLDEEFEFSGNKLWMMRDVGKVLMRLVDEFPTNNKANSLPPKTTNKSTKSFRLPIDVDGLTTRPEWSTAVTKIEYYGNDMNSARITKQFGHVIDEALKSLDENATNVDKQIATMNAIGRPTKILLQGPRGVGKSACLNQMVIHARRNGWLCLFVPKAWDHVHGGSFIEPCRTSAGEGLFDNVFVTVSMLRSFWKAHRKILSQQPIQNKSVLDKFNPYLNSFREAWARVRAMGSRQSQTFIQTRAIVEDEDNFPDEDEIDADVLEGFDFDTFQPKTLEDLIILGVAFRDLAGLLTIDLIEELKLIENIPVLIVIDQYNTWVGASGYQFENKPVMASQLCVPKALSSISKYKNQTDSWNLKNGLVVCAVSCKHPEGRKDNLLNKSHSIPITIHVPVYSKIEFLAAVKYYMHQNRMEDIFTTQELLAFRSHCASSPRLVKDELIPFLLPLAFEKYPGDFLLQPRMKGELAALEANNANKGNDDSDE